MSLADLGTVDTLKRCANAAELTYAGQFEQAAEALGPFWQGVGERPTLDEYPSETRAEILLQCGTLSSLLGAAQANDVQERAKDLLCGALRIFEAINNQAKIAETNYELGCCYFRAGTYDDARIVLTEAVDGATSELQGKIIIVSAGIELFAGRCEKANEILIDAKPLFDTASDALKGRWHAHMGLVQRRLARGRIEHLDRAIIEYTAAIYHYELAGHVRFSGNNLNNLAFLLYKLGRYPEAHEQLDRAHLIFSRLRDRGNVAQVEETRARAFIAEKRYVDAGRVLTSVIEVLESSGEMAMLVDAITNKAIVQARLGDNLQASQTFSRAIRLGEQSGVRFNTGLAAISMMEELKLTNRALFRAYQTADQCLLQTQDEEALSRLRNCAGRAISQLGGPQIDKNFSLRSALRLMEGRYIEEALIKSQGQITKAASLLGISHQALRHIMDTRQKELLSARLPPKRRFKSLIKNR